VGLLPEVCRTQVIMRVPLSSWTLFIIMTLGLIVLLVGQRPELSGPEGRSGAGKTVQIVGHSIAWSAAAVLTVRMIRSARSSSNQEITQHEQPRQIPAEPDDIDDIAV
jgi:hypothetical protein